MNPATLRETLVLQTLGKLGTATTTEVALTLGLESSSVKFHGRKVQHIFGDLGQKGLIQRIGEGRRGGGGKQKFALSADGARLIRGSQPVEPIYRPVPNLPPLVKIPPMPELEVHEYVPEPPEYEAVSGPGVVIQEVRKGPEPTRFQGPSVTLPKPPAKAPTASLGAGRPVPQAEQKVSNDPMSRVVPISNAPSARPVIAAPKPVPTPVRVSPEAAAAVLTIKDKLDILKAKFGETKLVNVPTLFSILEELDDRLGAVEVWIKGVSATPLQAKKVVA